MLTVVAGAGNEETPAPTDAVSSSLIDEIVRAGATFIDGKLVERPKPEDMIGSQKAA